MRSNRSGLGTAEASARKKAERQAQQAQQAQRRAAEERVLAASYVQGRAGGYAERRALSLLAQARSAVETLDRRQDPGAPRHPLFWPPEPAPTAAEADIGGGAQGRGGQPLEAGGESAQEAWDALPATERLREVTGHLRREHTYCLFCGCAYEDEGDLARHCPGEREDDH